MCKRHICYSFTLTFLVIDALQINQHAPKPFFIKRSESTAMEQKEIVALLVLLLRSYNIHERPPMDSHQFPTDYKAVALTNAPPRIVSD